MKSDPTHHILHWFAVVGLLPIPIALGVSLLDGPFSPAKLGTFGDWYTGLATLAVVATALHLGTSEGSERTQDRRRRARGVADLVVFKVVRIEPRVALPLDNAAHLDGCTELTIFKVSLTNKSAETIKFQPITTSFEELRCMFFGSEYEPNSHGEVIVTANRHRSVTQDVGLLASSEHLVSHLTCFQDPAEVDAVPRTSVKFEIAGYKAELDELGELTFSDGVDD